jgi:microcystin-dependent protein
MSELLGATERAGIEAESGTERPLNDQERAVIQRLLSDPFAFPIQFKTWLVSFLEGSDILLPRSNVQGLSSLLGSGGGQGVLGLLPAGMIFSYGGAAAPIGALLCNGAPYSRAGYKRLFDAVGTAFGAGDGSTTFNVPDLRRRTIWGAGSGDAALGSSDGLVEASRDIDHHHYFGQTSNAGGAHDHDVGMSDAGDHNHPRSIVGGGGNYDALTNLAAVDLGSGGTFRTLVSGGANFPQNAGSHSHPAWTSTDGDHQHFVDGDTSGGGAQDHPSYLTVGFIINY